MIYLALPFSHKSLLVRNMRFEIANRVAAVFMRAGHVVFSPLSHTVPIAPYVLHDLGTKEDSWAFWEKQDLHILGLCQQMVVLCLKGWEESAGLKAEMKFARKKGIRIVLISHDEIREML